MRHKKVCLIIGLLAAALVIGAATVGWRFYSHSRWAAQYSRQRTTTMQLTGTSGSPFTGYYVVDGKRVEVSGVLPSRFADAGVWQCEFRKANLSDTLVLEARDSRSYLHFTAAPGMRGVRANTKVGWNVRAVVD